MTRNWSSMTWDQIADALLSDIPEELRDKPNDHLLDRMTPRQAAEHVRHAGCPMCRSDLQDAAEAA